MVVVYLLVGLVCSSLADDNTGCKRWNSSYTCTYGDVCSAKNAEHSAVDNNPFPGCWFNNSRCQVGSYCPPRPRSPIPCSYQSQDRTQLQEAVEAPKDVVVGGDYTEKLCIVQKEYYIVQIIPLKQCKYRYVKVPASSSFYSNDVWISLSSNCNISNDDDDIQPLPCRKESSLVVMKGTLSSDSGTVDDTYYCSNGIDIHGTAGKYYIDPDGDVAFLAGYLPCCPVGGEVGDTDTIPVTVKLKFKKSQSLGDSISGISRLHYCEKQSSPIGATMYVPGAGDLVKWNYTLPSLTCHVAGVNSSASVVTVSSEDTIHCSLYLSNVPADRALCVFSNSSATLQMTVSCSGEGTSVRDVYMDMKLADDYKFNVEFQVSDQSHPGCLLRVTGRYLKPLSTEWMPTKGTIAFQVAEEHSTSVQVGALVAGVTIGSMVIIVLIVCIVRRRRRRMENYRPADMEVTTPTAPMNSETAPINSETAPTNSETAPINREPVDDSSSQIACLFSENNETANDVIQCLESKGIKLRKYLQPGKAKSMAIVDKLESCHKILVLLSCDYLRSNESGYAISQAVLESIVKNGKVVVIPVLLEDCEVPKELRQLVDLDLNKSINFWERLFEALQKH